MITAIFFVTLQIAENIYFLYKEDIFEYDSLFPKAEKIKYPDYSSIESITVSRDGEQIHLSDEECRVLYKHIRTAKPTRNMSVNETPDVTPFFTVEIKSKEISVYGYGHISRK